MHSTAALVKVVGYSITKWSERRMASTKLYSGREEYLSSQTYLLGSENGEFGSEIISKFGMYNPLPLFFFL